MASRVYVDTLLFSGWAEVVGYEPDDFYPISIVLDEGDADGHKYKRVSKDDITRRE